MGTCCSKDDADKLEAVESKAHERDRGGFLDVVPTAPETPVVEESAPAPRDGEFIIVLDKTNGERLGMDVDHEDGRTLAVDAITGGLIQKWNEEHPDKALKPKDRIVEVNGLRGDVLQLVDECKKPKVLKIYVKRESAH
ncbi:Putative NADPH:quinone oxidoreductase 1 [Durusdinium trenchii]|uniref:NADPH:quinone oxidoreductase 1 n=1 Tax=Durusdinium trenchii TaxID=1381693 RepID=A0ABP0JF91_9DINO